MTALSIDVKIDDAQVRAMLTRLSQRMGNLTPVMHDIGLQVVEWAQHSIDTETDPYGVRFKPMSLATKIARARRLSGGKGIYTKGKKDGTGRVVRAPAYRIITTAKLLKDRGNLYSSIKVINANANSVTVGVNTAGPAAYAGVQQFGGGKSRIPARPFLPMKGLTPAHYSAIREIIERKLNGLS